MYHPETITYPRASWQEGNQVISAGDVPPAREVPRSESHAAQGRSRTRTIAEITERMERVSQQLQRFQARHGMQLSHTERQWLHVACHEVELYRALLSQLLRMQGMPPERLHVLQQMQELVQRARVLAQVARQAAQTARTTRRLLQEARRNRQTAARAADHGRDDAQDRSPALMATVPSHQQ
jgi:hypothetical protein